MIFPPALRASVLCLAFSSVLLAQSFTFRHYAGTDGGPSFEDGTGTAARFKSIRGLAMDHDGNAYVADGSNTVRRITPAGVVTTLAGLAGTTGSTDGSGGQARFTFLTGLAIGPDGTLYVADEYAIRRVTPSGTVTTLAGAIGWSGTQDGNGSEARFGQLGGIAVGADGTLFVTDRNHTVRKITSSGVVSTVAGLANQPGAADGVGSQARFYYPNGLTVANDGTIYVADYCTIRKITPQGVVTTIAGAAIYPGSTDGDALSARFQGPGGVALSVTGDLYVTDTYNNTIRRITPGGVVSTLAGLAETPGHEDGTGSSARFDHPFALVIDNQGDLLVGASYALRRVTVSGVTTTFAGRGPLSGSTDGIGTAARFKFPAGVASDLGGNLYLTDSKNHTIRKIDHEGNVTTFAGLAGASGSTDATGDNARFDDPRAIAFEPTGNLIAVETHGNRLRRIGQNQGVTTIPNLFVSAPGPVDVDSAGNIYFIQGTTIQKVDAAGTQTTFAGSSYGSADGTGTAAQFSYAAGIAVDSTGNVFVSDSGNYTIRKITSGGVVTTLAGVPNSYGSQDGTGNGARFFYPYGLTVGTDGALYVADHGNATVRRVTMNGDVTTVGGRAIDYGSTDGTATDSRFFGPTDIAMDGAGNLYVTDGAMNSVRIGVPAIPGVATIDAAEGAIGEARHLGTTSTATEWKWELVRRPACSIAQLSSATSANPTFTPDVADVFIFRLTASSSTGSSMSTVTLTSGTHTTTALAVSAASSGCSQSRTLTATINSSVAGVTSGSVAFKSEGRVLANVPVAGGQASLNLSLQPGTHSFTAEYSGDTAHLSSVSSTVSHEVTADVPATPNVFTATATASNRVKLVWATVPCATFYRIENSSYNAPFGLLVQTSGSPFEYTVPEGVTIRYLIKAGNSAGLSAATPIDSATTILFSDDPLVSGVTAIKSAHITELRSAVNSFRQSAGLTSYAFTDATLSGTAIRMTHVLELRAALNSARTSLGLAPIDYSDQLLTVGSTPVSTLHLQRLRDAVK